MRQYYVISGSFANAQCVKVFRSKAQRDRYVRERPDNSMLGSHYEHDARAATRREVDRLLASNRARARLHRGNSAYDENFGSTEIPEIEPA